MYLLKAACIERLFYRHCFITAVHGELQTHAWIGIDDFHRGLPPAPHPHFRIVEFRKPATEMTSDLVGYVRTTQVRTVNLRAMISARKSSRAVYFRTRGTTHNRSACGERSAHLISATRTQLNDGSLPKLFQTAASQMIGIVMYIMLKIEIL